MSDNVLVGHQWNPLAPYGFTHSFWNINTEIVISTSVILLIIIVLSLASSYALRKNENGVASFMVLSYVRLFKNMLEETMNASPLKYLSFIASLFTFIALCNTISLIPWLEEPTRDINTTIALGTISFMYVQIEAVRVGGIVEYLKDYLHPFFLMLPLNVIGKVTSIISLSFRLFGNIFGGYIILSLYNEMLSQSIFLQTLGLASGINLGLAAIFSVFEGLMQAFVFSMLSLTYLSMEVSADEDEDDL